ncbi:MAG: right-handed parallel beta-helix repeat-containing protein, partial [Lentisphaeria bacterium]|nr:right-handed parallel beta-helix repeat-containing protein [Lentisphaeria bacterium]
MRKTAFLLLCWMSAVLSGATYYVSPAGSDKNPGTDPARPAKSINRILQKTKSGDTVMLKGGIYREQISMEWANKNPNPITIKAFPDETPVISWGWRVKGWEKLANGLMVADFPYAVCDIWQKITLDRYLKVDSMELLQRQPGAFLQDPGNGKIYLNPLDGSWHKDPESAGFIAVPYAGRVRPPSWKAESLNRRPGMNLVGHNIHVDGLSFEFHPAKGFYLRGRQKGLFYGSGSIRNCCAVGTTCGLSTGWYVDGVTFENCVSIRNSGAGLHTGGAIKNIRIINNFLLNNGSSLPFYGNYTAGSGNVYNLAHYGGSDAAFVDVINNKVISVDKSRSGGVMRYKPGIRKHTNHLNNLYLGGGVTLYSVPGSTASIRNNSVLPGIFNFTVPNTGEKYTPDMKDNLELRPRAQLKKARFVNPEKLDYRLLPDSKYLGKGFAPAAAPVWFVKPGSKGGNGRPPEKPLSSLAEL